MADAHDPVTVELLRDVAEEAGRAPSILNSQPWRWHVHQGSLDLYADRDRQVAAIDAHGRMLIVSCGAALHHARVALMYRGFEPDVDRLPDPSDADLLATITVTGTCQPSRRDLQEHDSLRRRRSERRLSPPVPVPAAALAAMCASAEAEQIQPHHVAADQIAVLAMAAKIAQATQASDDDALAQLRDWERRTRTSGQGVPPETVVAPVDRPVPLRDLTSGGATLLHAGFGDDTFAEYVVLATAGDQPLDWLRAGEATSAAWLAATGQGLSASVISDVIEVSEARDVVRSMVGPGHPQLVMRLAMGFQPTPAPATPRRPASEFIDIDSAG